MADFPISGHKFDFIIGKMAVIVWYRSRAEAMSNSEKIKPVALAIVELRSIRQLVS